MSISPNVERGRDLCAERSWAAAYGSLSAADPAALTARDLELLAVSEFMLGRDGAYVDAWEFAYHSHLRAGAAARAALCTWRIGDYLLFRGESARGGVVRSRACAARAGEGGLRRARLSVAADRSRLRVSVQDHEAAFAAASEAGEIGARFADRDLVALAMMERGHALVRKGNVAEGWRLARTALVSGGHLINPAAPEVLAFIEEVRAGQ